MYDIDSNGSVDRQEMLKIIEVRSRSSLTGNGSCLQSIYDLLGAGITKNASNGGITGRDPNDTPENRTAQIFAVMVRFSIFNSKKKKSFSLLFLIRMKIKMGEYFYRNNNL